MKYAIKFVIIICLPLWMNAQSNFPDSLRLVLNNATNDSVRFQLNDQLADYYAERDRDSAFYYSDKCIELAKKNKKRLSNAQALSQRGWQCSITRQYGASLQYFLQAFEIAEDPECEKSGWFFNTTITPENERLRILSELHQYYGLLMKFTQNYEQAIIHFKESIRIAWKINNISQIIINKSILGNTYLEINETDSALLVEKEAVDIYLQTDYTWTNFSLPLLYWNLGQVYMSKGNKLLARQYFFESIQKSREQNFLSGLGLNYLQLTKYYLGEGEKDSALFYAKQNLKAIQSIGIATGIIDLGQIYENLYLSYNLRNQFDSAYKYQGLALIAKDSLNQMKLTNLADFQKLTLSEQLRLRDVEKEKELYQTRLRMNAILGITFTLFVIAVFLFILSRRKQKAKQKIESAFNQLKSTQAQLIQSEKMASLGELTAGIAHEIQNPLNFVNNFSEVSNELIDEMKEELATGNLQLATEIADDVKQNLEKINHHGKRADAIVKGMLQHSRTSTGQKELTDINALADEYLRLAYHGMRAKDKSFNADFKTEFDENLAKINVIPQDIGRVLLNLINNAFYAAPLPPEGGFKDPEYVHRPTVIVKTSYLPPSGVSPDISGGMRGAGTGGACLVSVSDNGPGIPDSIKDKIFQPFFTTKPTGSGTGLGLSLSYDIVKAHGGELKVETKVGEGSEFIIHLPLNS